MKRHLVLFTANHPFDRRGGETMFVAPELAHLAQAFESVTVAPLYDPGPALPLPPGVVVDRRLARGWARGLVVHAVAALAWPGVFAETARAARLGGLKGLARVWRWAGRQWMAATCLPWWRWPTVRSTRPSTKGAIDW